MKEFRTKAGTILPIMDLKGKPYLQVAHRIVWFREEHPDASIDTSFVSISDSSAVARAVVSYAGKVMSTAHKREDAKHFGDFTEKAETGAIGRALALLGYGTQFTGEDFEEGDRLADSPIAPVYIKPIDRPAFYNDPNHPANNGDGFKADDTSLDTWKCKATNSEYKDKKFYDLPLEKWKGYYDWFANKYGGEGRKIPGYAEEIKVMIDKHNAENSPITDEAVPF